jgi:regulation of enolase protein 1 (concanavalin A-like superfamily)
MSWPLSQDYNESIQDPRHSFGDAELKTGEAVTNPLGIPLPRSGNFADVYEVRCPSGSRWAVKCFTREVAGLRERYNEISKYLHQTNLPFMVDFQYLEEGIRVRGGWYPILKMQWVEGFVLNEFVRDNLDKKPILQAMSQIWLRMARRLRDAKLAHCDLQHGNVLLVPGSTANSLAVKLIDYDGMCVPALAGKKSGEVGHPAFQHPERLKTGAYNQEVDRFSLLAIAAGLRCLTVGGRSLWERYDNGDNLLFRQSDLQSPGDSPLFQELLEIPDAQAQSLVMELFRACRGPLDKVPLLTDLMPEEKRASKGATASATAKESAAGEGADWDFNEDESAAPGVSKRRAPGKRSKRTWITAGGAAAVLLLAVSVGARLMMRNNPAEQEGTPVAQNKPEVKKPTPPAKPLLPEPSRPAPTAEPPRQPVKIAETPPPKSEPPARPFDEAPVAPMAVAWYKPIDPNNDCTFKHDGGKLTISVPGTYHDLNVADARTDAPRMLLEVEGDFTAQVRIRGDFQPSTTSTAARHDPSLGAGLLLWSDAKTLVRLERVAMLGRNGQVRGAFWDAWQEGQHKVEGRIVSPLTGGEAYLRLERQGDKVHPAVSADGVKWNELAALEIDLPPKIKIGMAALSTSTDPFAPIFDRFQLKNGPGPMVRIDLTPATMDPVAAKPPVDAPMVWDKPIDPDRDCTFETARRKLTIAVPGRHHELAVESRHTNAPRLLGEVTGDFTAQVRLRGDWRCSPNSMPKGLVPLVAGGLLLWVDDNNYIRLERKTMHMKGKQITLPNWELREDGKKKSIAYTAAALVSKELHLRIERRANSVLGSFSEDGKKWKKVKPIEISLRKTVRIGVYAVSTSSAPFAPVFDQFQMQKDQGEMVRVDWPMLSIEEAANR